jgi:hypothetical protein
VQKLLHVAGNQLLLLISSFYVGLHFVVWKWRENQSRIETRIMDRGSTSRETARALEPLNSTSEDKEFKQVKKVTQKSINKISILTCV